MLDVVFSYFCLTIFGILFFTCTATYFRMYKGSKSTFGYILMFFTYGNALNRLASFVTNFFPQQVNGFLIPDGYIALTINYEYTLISLQSWIFAMKYMKIASEISLSPTKISTNFINKLSYAGMISYSTLLITCWCFLMITFPGYTDLNSAFKWFKDTYGPVYFTSRLVWLIFNILSSVFTIWGILTMLKFLQLLKQSNPRVKTNKPTLTVHCMVLLLNLISVFLASLPEKFFYNPTRQISKQSAPLIDYVLIVTDTIVQLFICYICWTMGSSTMLRQFQITLQTDHNGIPICRLSPITTIASIRESDLQDELQNLTDLGSNSDLAQLTRDSIISSNERGCLEILMQFIEDEQVLLDDHTSQSQQFYSNSSLNIESEQ